MAKKKPVRTIKEIYAEIRALRTKRKENAAKAQSELQASISELLAHAEKATANATKELVKTGYLDTKLLISGSDYLGTCIEFTRTVLAVERIAYRSSFHYGDMQDVMDKLKYAFADIKFPRPRICTILQKHAEEDDIICDTILKLDDEIARVQSAKRAAAYASGAEYKYFLALKKKYEEQNSV